MQTTGLMCVCERVNVCKRMVSVEWTMKWKHPITISLHLSIRTSSMQREHSWVASSLFTITHRSADKWGAEGEKLVRSTLQNIQGIEKQTCSVCMTRCNMLCNLWARYLSCLIVNINCREVWTYCICCTNPLQRQTFSSSTESMQHHCATHALLNTSFLMPTLHFGSLSIVYVSIFCKLFNLRTFQSLYFLKE